MVESLPCRSALAIGGGSSFISSSSSCSVSCCSGPPCAICARNSEQGSWLWTRGQVPCVFRLYGPQSYLDKMKELVDALFAAELPFLVLTRIRAHTRVVVRRLVSQRYIEMYATTGWGQALCPFYGGCPPLGVSVIGGSTVNTREGCWVDAVVVAQWSERRQLRSEVLGSIPSGYPCIFSSVCFYPDLPPVSYHQLLLISIVTKIIMCLPMLGVWRLGGLVTPAFTVIIG